MRNHCLYTVKICFTCLHAAGMWDLIFCANCDTDRILTVYWPWYWPWYWPLWKMVLSYWPLSLRGVTSTPWKQRSVWRYQFSQRSVSRSVSRSVCGQYHGQYQNIWKHLGFVFIHYIWPYSDIASIYQVFCSKVLQLLAHRRKQFLQKLIT